jgi:hypothetical protein
MIGSRAWRALMRRNLIYRKRNIVGTVSQSVSRLPALFEVGMKPSEFHKISSLTPFLD